MLFYHWLFPTRALQSPHPSPPLPCITIPPPLSSPPLHYNPPTPLLPSLALQFPYPSLPLPLDETEQVVLKVNCHQVLLKERNYQHNDESQEQTEVL